MDHAYRIGKYEVSVDMISKANAEGGLGITVDALAPDKPATSVSWNEAAIFINWLNTSSGRPTAYKFDHNGEFQLWEPGDAGYDSANPYRNSLATYWLPSADEWFKAAYYDADTGTYFDYATGSHTVPAPVAGGTAEGTSVYGQLAAAGPADITNAGGLSPYGTMGQGGNAFEWEETAYDLGNDTAGESRGLRGGAWFFDSIYMKSSSRVTAFPTAEFGSIGFRVAASTGLADDNATDSVPEPSRALLAMIGVTSVLLSRKRRLASC